ncbi:MAG: DUF4199 family protein [Cytophagaceae bacterium]|jgi:hypothetical protein|nr:DUF4199 family protein [Cytophagaceae bacterium]
MNPWINSIPFAKEVIVGLCMALATFVSLIVEYQFGFHGSLLDYYYYVSLAKWIIIFGILGYSIYQLYLSMPPGVFTIKDGLMRGAIISVVAAFGKILSYGVFLKWINPDFLKDMTTHQIKLAVIKGENVIGVIDEARQNFNFQTYLMSQFSTVLLIGLLVSLLVSYRLVKQSQYRERKKTAGK